MSFNSIFRRGAEAGDDRELRQLRERYASLLQAYNEVKASHESLSQAFDRGKAEFDRLVASREHAMRELSSLREEKTTLRGQKVILEKELQACKDDLFRMQPVSQVTDSTIAQRLEYLNVQICDWIASEVSRSMDEWQRKHPGRQPKLFHHGGDTAAKAFLTQYPEMGGEYLVRSVLHRFLQQNLFNDGTALFGLDTNAASLLEAIEQGMSKLQPQREAMTIRGWRSEAFASLAEVPLYPVQLKEAKAKLAEETFELLSHVFPVISKSHTSMETLYDEVITPAVELATTIQTSTTSYHFEPPTSSASMFKGYSVSKTGLSECRMIDVASGKTLKRDSVVVSDSDGVIGEYIMTLWPALYRCDDKDKFVPLSQEIILVELDKPLGRRRAVKLEPDELA